MNTVCHHCLVSLFIGVINYSVPSFADDSDNDSESSYSGSSERSHESSIEGSSESEESTVCSDSDDGTRQRRKPVATKLKQCVRTSSQPPTKPSHKPRGSSLSKAGDNKRRKVVLSKYIL